MTDKSRISWNAAMELLAKQLQPIDETCLLNLTQTLPETCMGQVLASPVVSAIDVPGHCNSAVDGYAARHSELISGRPLSLIKKPIAAGDLTPLHLPPNSVQRIFTGAIMPTGADTVLMFEDAHITHNQQVVSYTSPPHKGANVRHAGEDVCQDAPIASAGEALTPFLISRLHASSVNSVKVYRQLRIQIFSTGNELVPLGTHRPEGKVIDSNAPMLRALLSSAGFSVEAATHLPDSRKDIEDALAKAATQADVILTSGGVSEGDADHVSHALMSLGSLHFWRINIKPGRPLALGKIGKTTFIGLPGNPVAVAVCLGMIAIPILRRLAGRPFHPPIPIAVQAGFSERFKGNRREFLRASFHEKNSEKQFENKAPDNSHPTLRRCYRRLGDGSGLLSSLAETDGLLEIPEGQTLVTLGDELGFYSYASLFSGWSYPLNFSNL